MTQRISPAKPRQCFLPRLTIDFCWFYTYSFSAVVITTNSRQDGGLRVWWGWYYGFVLLDYLPCPGFGAINIIVHICERRWVFQSTYSRHTCLQRNLEAEIVDGCQCTECIKHRKLIIQDRGSFLNPKTNKQWAEINLTFFVFNCLHRTYLLLAGWSFFAFVSYKVSQLKVENKVYNPFEILGIKTVRFCICRVWAYLIPCYIAYARQGHKSPLQKPLADIVSEWKYPVHVCPQLNVGPVIPTKSGPQRI